MFEELWQCSSKEQRGKKRFTQNFRQNVQMYFVLYGGRVNEQMMGKKTDAFANHEKKTKKKKSTRNRGKKRSITTLNEIERE